MRIVGGKYRGLTLLSPKDDRIRPTSDRVRESLFNILSHMPDFTFEGAVVLDGFCGTGALGLEALSRGADECIFSDTAKSSLDLCRRNAQKFMADKKITFINQAALQAGASARISDHSLSLVFLDPPYGQDLALPVIKKLQSEDKLTEGCFIVIEMSGKHPDQPPGQNFNLIQERMYGTTIIRIYQYHKK